MCSSLQLLYFLCHIFEVIFTTAACSADPVTIPAVLILRDPAENQRSTYCMFLIQFHSGHKKPLFSFFGWLLVQCFSTLHMVLGYYLVCRFWWWNTVNNSAAFSIYPREASIQAGKHLTPVLSSLQGEKCYIHRHASQIKENTGSAALSIHSHVKARYISCTLQQ